MIGTLQTLAAFAFVLGVLIFVHEFGHFAVARLYGVRVLRFSLGFDPKLVKFTRGGTEYSIGLIPLGGFVKLAGETVEDSRSGAPDEFLSKSKWVRLQVYLAGPIMNMILAVLLLTVVISRGVDVPLFEDQAPVVGAVTPGSTAERAGLKPGDRIIRIDDRAVKTWNEANDALERKSSLDPRVSVDRGGAVVPLALSRTGVPGILPVGRTEIAAVTPGGPADRAGLQRGDFIVALNGQHFQQPDVVDHIHKSQGEPLVFTVERDGRARDISVVAMKVQDERRIQAVISYEYRHKDVALAKAFPMSVNENWIRAGLIGESLSGLVRGRTSVKELSGPLKIAQLSGEAARLGWLYLLNLMAVISLNLGLINLLPIPVMDGGQIAILGFEGLIRRELSMRLKERILLAGAAVVILLMVTVIFNDVVGMVK